MRHQSVLGIVQVLLAGFLLGHMGVSLSATALSNGISLNPSVPAQTYFNFYIEVPDNATRLTATLSNGSGDFDLYLAKEHEMHGATIPELDASADAISDGPSANESISITPSTQLPLSGGRWYIAVLNLNATETRVTLTVRYEAPSVPVFSLAIDGPDSVMEGASAAYRLMATGVDGHTQVVQPIWILDTPSAMVSAEGLLSGFEVSMDVRVVLRAGLLTDQGYSEVSKSIAIRDLSTDRVLTGLIIEGEDRIDEASSARYEATAYWGDSGYSTVAPIWTVEPDICAIDAGGVLTTQAVDRDQPCKIVAEYSANGATLTATHNVTVLSVRVPGSGYEIRDLLWLRAIISDDAVSSDAFWRQTGETISGDGTRVIWGYFHADPQTWDWASEVSPDLFVRAEFSPGGTVQVVYFHASVANVRVQADRSKDGVVDEQSELSGTQRFAVHTFAPPGSGCSDDDEQNQPSCSYSQSEDGAPSPGTSPDGMPVGFVLGSFIRLGATRPISNEEPEELLWFGGGSGITPRGDTVAWGHFQSGNGVSAIPDLLVKIWFDVSGEVWVDYFDIGGGDLSAFSGFPGGAGFSQAGRMSPSNRYLRHGYRYGGADVHHNLPASVPAMAASLEIPGAGYFVLAETQTLSPGELPAMTGVLQTLYQGVPVAFSLYVPGSGAVEVDCRQTALVYMIHGNANFLLPSAFVPDLKHLLGGLPETGQLANGICIALAQDPGALQNVSSGLATRIEQAQAAARQSVFDIAGGP